MTQEIDFNDPSLVEFFGKSIDLSGLEQAGDAVRNSKEAELAQLVRLQKLLEQYQTASQEAGIHKWFVPGTPFGIENCHKHRAFFEAGATYNERLFLAGNRCHVAGTKVWMADGSDKNIEDVVVGDKVLAYNKATHSLVESSVVDTYAGIADNVSYYEGARTEQGIGTTDDHKFLTLGQRGQYHHKPISEFRYWDKAVVPTRWSLVGTDPGFSPDVAKLVGLLVGDGHLSPIDSQYKLTNKSEEVLEFAETVAKEELGLDPRRSRQRGYTDLFFPKIEKKKGTSSLGKLLEELGLVGTTSGTKFVPKQILLAPEEHVRAFLQGLFAADAHYRKGRITYYTTSYELARGVGRALLRLGVYSRMHKREHDNPNHATCYQLEIAGDTNTLRVGDAIHKKVVLRGADRQTGYSRQLATKKKCSLPKQEVYCITVKHPDHLFVANGFITENCGKSVAGSAELAMHLTGEYPSWWTGRRFDQPIRSWAVGSTARAARDTIQKELIGPPGAWGTGMIPRDSLGKFWSLSGVPQGIDMIQVKHVSGGWSMVGFKNYEQPLQAFYGTDLHVIWLDEEVPQDVYNECLIRTMTTNGIIYCTFTPLKGLTPMVVKFSEKADYLAGAQKLIGVQTEKSPDEEEGEDARLANRRSHKAIIQAGWDDAPWLTEEKKEQMLEDTEPHLREARRSGRPSMGSGNVYPIAIESLLVEPFKIPDYWKKVYALDVGWNVTACVWGALDPQTDTLYLYDEYYGKEAVPAVHAQAIRARGTWIPGVIDPASRGRSQVDGTQLMQVYKDLGLKLWPANNEVESGLQSMWQRMTTQNLKVFSHMTQWAKEFVLYRRDLKGRIVKDNDHLMDASRYVQNNLLRAKSIDQLRATTTYRSKQQYDI